MTKKRGGIIAALAAVALLGAAAPATAQGPVDEVLLELGHCGATVDEPSGNPIVGSGGFSCRAVHREIAGTVCLVYNGVTVASSCNVLRSSDGSDYKSTKPTMCLPGLWQTQVTVAHAHGPDTEVLSDAVLYTCIDPG